MGKEAFLGGCQDPSIASWSWVQESGPDCGERAQSCRSRMRCGRGAGSCRGPAADRRLGGVAGRHGGSWIHHPVGNPLRVFADQVGVSCTGANPLPAMAAFDCGERRRLTPREARASIRMFYEGFPEAVRRLSAELGPTVPAARAIDDFVVGLDLPRGSQASAPRACAPSSRRKQPTGPRTSR